MDFWTNDALFQFFVEECFLPCAIVMGPIGIIAAILLWLWYRKSAGILRQRAGRCTKCGYLLRGLTEARCPECGTPFDPKQLAAEAPQADEDESDESDRPGEASESDRPDEAGESDEADDKRKN